MFSAYLWPLAVANVCTLKTHLTMDGYAHNSNIWCSLGMCWNADWSSIFCPFCLRPKSNPFRCSFKISAWYKSEVIVVGGRADPYKSVQQGLHCLETTDGQTFVQCWRGTRLPHSSSAIVRAQQQDKYKYKTLLDNCLQQTISCCQSPESLTLPFRNSSHHDSLSPH